RCNPRIRAYLRYRNRGNLQSGKRLERRVSWRPVSAGLRRLDVSGTHQRIYRMTATNREPIKKKGGDDMENVKRILPYVRRYVLMAIYDELDEESISYHKKEDAIVARAKVYGNVSVFSISAEEKEVGTELKVALLRPCGGLSEQGKEPTMAAMSDQIVQYLENELLMNRHVERLNHEPENGSVR